MRAAVIDIGSSSIRLVIGERDKEEIKIIETLKNVVPMGHQTFFRGYISQEIINQTISLLERYKQTLAEYAITNVTVIATTAVREARNKDIFLDTIFRKTGFKIDVLNVGDVVYYIDSYLSHKLKEEYPIHEKNLIIAELGAGTLDISVLEKGFTLMNAGFPIGTLRLQQFKAKLDGSLEETYEAIRELIANEMMHVRQMIPDINIDDIILIDERYSGYLKKFLSERRGGGNLLAFKRSDSDEMVAQVSTKNTDEIAAAYKIPQEIADALDEYALIINALYQLTKNDYIYIFETSLSEAILAHSLFDFEETNKNNKMSQLISVANFLCRKYNQDIKHAQHVASLSDNLFKQLKDVLGLKDDDLIYLILAAYLHDIGMFINNRAHHKHTEYIISALSLFRLTDEEIKIIACVGRYHRRSDPLRTHLLFNSLSSDKQILVQKLSALLKIANSLDQSHRQKVAKLEVKVGRKQDITLVVATAHNFILEKANFLEKKDLFEEITGNKITLSIKN